MWLILFVIPYIVNASLLGLHQDDPLLINQIKPLIHPPSELDYNFTKEPDLNGQFGQAIEVSKLLGGQTNGFFIEAGAFNGQDISNTLLLEMQYNWTGILIEPNPDLYQEMLTKQRKSYCLETCLSTEKEVQKVDFDATGAYGGIMNGEDLKPGSRADEAIKQRKESNPDFVPTYGTFVRRTLQMQCLPLTSIIEALGNPVIDYFSLDIEGAEFPVLKTIDFDKVDIRVISIEVTKLDSIFDGRLTQLKYLMKRNGYEFYKEVKEDYIYVKKGLLSKDEL